MKAAYPNLVKTIAFTMLLPLLLLFSAASIGHTQPKSDGAVVIFTTTWCPYCKRLRDYLHSLNVEFTEYDIEKSAVGRQKYESLNGHGVPVVLVCTQRLDGFDQGDVKRALKSCGIIQ